MNIPKAGLITGLLLFITGLGGGIFLFEWLRVTPFITITQGYWVLFTLVPGLPLFGIIVIAGMYLSVRSLRDLQNTSQQKAVGWFFFISGFVVLIYLLQYSVTGILLWLNKETGPYTGTLFYDGARIGIISIYILSLAFSGIMIFAAWKIAHPKKRLQPTPQLPDEPAEQ